jgi:hypothetical protein
MEINASRRTDEPNFQIATGQLFVDCPRAAYHAGEVVACYAVKAATTLPTPQIIQRVACAVGVTPARVSVSLGQVVGLRVVLESLLRVSEVNAILLDVPTLSSLLGAPVEYAERCDRTYAHYPPDATLACPNGTYYFAGDYRRLPPHAHALLDCYGYACDTGFSRDSAGNCAPTYVDNSVFWLVCTLVAVFLLATVILALAIRGCVSFKSAQEPQESDSDDAVLPVAVDDEGKLVFEAVEADQTEAELAFEADPTEART